MTVEELIKELQELKPETLVMLHDHEVGDVHMEFTIKRCMVNKERNPLKGFYKYRFRNPDEDYNSVVFS